MSNHRKKIKYTTEGAYGSREEHTLYMDMNNVCDITTFYYEDGTPIFSYEDTADDNILKKMVEVSTEWKDNPNIEPWTAEDVEKMKRK